MSANEAEREARGLRYGATPAVQFLDFIGPLHGTVLDVGSGEGAWAPLLRQSGAKKLIAIEPYEASAVLARSAYDEVISERVEDVDPAVIGAADVIVAADCLEHLVDPWAALKRLRGHARPGSVLAVSVPNLQYLGILGPALLRGRFEYSDEGGVMDRGHLRWFTRPSLDATLVGAGWRPRTWSGSCGHGTRARLDRISGHRLSGVLRHQLFCLADPA
jgi:SAM-dependent methyltransferase